MLGLPENLGSSPPRRGGIPHLPALDGLRGLALLGVLFFHANGALAGGYLGVDLFFVLSGFLITSLLIAEHRDTGRVALAPFWIRRARRLFPALLSLMPAIAIYARFFARPSELAGLRADALATLAYVANWRAIFANKSYWELFASPSPLEHTWSLSIEEQFYVVWPLVVALLLRRGTRRSILALSLGLTALSVAAMLVLFNPEHVSRVYLGTDTRATGILAGAALATVLSPEAVAAFADSTVRKLDALGLIATLGLGVAWWKLQGQSWFLYHGGFWLTEAAVLALIVCSAAGSRSLVARALAFKPLTLVGTVSYGVYLWHWPINVLLSPERTHLHGIGLHVIQFTLTFAVALVSYRFLEQPIRRRGLPFGRPVVLVPAAVAFSVLLLVRATSLAGRIDVPVDNEPKRGSDWSLTVAPADFELMVVGDSTANSLGWVMRGVRLPDVKIDLMGKDGCTMLHDTCDGELWAKRTSELRPRATLMFVGGAFLHGISVEGQWHKACHEGWNRKFESTLTRRLADLKSPQGRIWAVTIPYPLGPYDSADYRAEVDCINRSIRKVSASIPGVRVLEFAEHLCPKGVCTRESAGAAIRPDGVHYTMDGGAELARWVLDEVLR